MEAEQKFQEAEQKHLNEKLETARRMLQDGLALEKVCEYQNLTEEQVAKLK